MAITGLQVLVGNCVLTGYLPGPKPVWESPIEGLFYLEADKRIPGLVPQYEIGPYRVDFAVPKYRIAVEIDGREFHSRPEQIARDRKRQKGIEAMGWYVIRFTGSQIYRDAESCAIIVRRLYLMRQILEASRNK